MFLISSISYAAGIGTNQSATSISAYSPSTSVAQHPQSGFTLFSATNILPSPSKFALVTESFRSFGLPAGYNWSITYGNVTEYSDTGYINFSLLPKHTYNFSIPIIYNSSDGCTTIYAPINASGSLRSGNVVPLRTYKHNPHTPSTYDAVFTNNTYCINVFLSSSRNSNYTTVYGATGKINVNLTSPNSSLLTGMHLYGKFVSDNFSLKVNGSGSISLPYYKLAAGRYKITFWTSNTLVRNVTVFLSVIKAKPVISLSSNPSENFSYNGSSVTFHGVISSLFSQLYSNMTVGYNGIKYYNERTNETVNLSAAAAGEYLVNVSTSGNENYTSAYLFEHFIVFKATPNISIELSPNSTYSYNGTELNFMGKIKTFGSQLSASLYLNGEYKGFTHSFIKYDNASAGSYNFVFNTTGNQNYTAYNKSASVSILKGHPVLKLFSTPNNNFTYNGTKFVYKAAVISYNNQLEASLYSQKVLVKKGFSNISYNGSASAGTYSLIFNTSGNANYTSGQVSLKDTIYKALPNLQIIPKFGNYTYNGSLNSISGEIDSVGNQLKGSIKINGVNKTTFGGAGNYTIDFYTLGNQNYTNGSKIIHERIAKATPQVILSTPGNYIYNGVCSINYSIATVHNQVGVSLFINNESSGSTFFNSTSHTCASAGTYNVTVSASGNQNYTSITKSSSFKIAKAYPSVFLFVYPNSNFIYNGKHFTITAELSSINNQLPASLYLDGKLLNLTRTNISYSNSSAGDYSFVFNTTGNQNYSSSTVAKKIIISKATPSMNLFITPGNFVYNGTKDTVIGSINSFDNQINGTVYVNGKKVNGSYSTARAGIYNVVFNESGNANYTNYSIKKLFNISKAKPVLEINISKNSLGTSANVTFRITSLYNQLLMNLTGINNSIFNTHGGYLTISHEGTYTITASTVGNTNYTKGSVFKILSINSTQTPFTLPTINYSDVLYRLPIRLVNNNTFEVNGSFQDMLNLSSYKLSAYEMPNLSNIEFSYTNGTVVPSWIESGATSSAGKDFSYFQGNGYIVPSNGFGWMNNASQQFTISLWVNPQSSNGVILDELGQQQPNTKWHDTWIDLVNSNVYIRVWGDACVNIGSIPVGQWSNLVLSYNGTSFNGYINGVYGGRTTGKRSVPGGNTQMYYALGSGDSTNCGAGNGFSGYMAGYAIYNTSLPVSTISNIYSKGVGSAALNNSTVLFMPLNSSSKVYYDISPVLYNIKQKPSQNTIYWLKINHNMSAGSYITIYADFMKHSIMNNVSTGEAPQLSKIYGQYNDIENVLHPGLAYRFYYSPSGDKCLPSPNSIYSQNILSNTSIINCGETVVSGIYYTNTSGIPEIVNGALKNNTIFNYQNGYSNGSAFPNITIKNPNSNFAAKAIGFIVSPSSTVFDTIIDDAGFLGAYYTGGNIQNWLSSYENSNNIINEWKGEGATQYSGTLNVCGSTRIEWLYSNEVGPAYDSLWTNNSNVSYYSIRLFQNGSIPEMEAGYPTKFVPVNLPSNATWQVTMNGKIYSSKGNKDITVYSLPGVYNYRLSNFAFSGSDVFVLNYLDSGSVTVSSKINHTIYVNFTNLGKAYVINSTVKLISNLNETGKVLFVTSSGSLYTENYNISANGIVNAGTFVLGDTTSFTTNLSKSIMNIGYLYNYGNFYLSKNVFDTLVLFNYGNIYHNLLAANSNQNESYSYAGSGGGGSGVADITYSFVGQGNNGGSVLKASGGFYGVAGYRYNGVPYANTGGNGTTSPVHLMNFTMNESLLTGAGGGDGAGRVGEGIGGDGATGLIINVTSFINNGTVYNIGQNGENHHIGPSHAAGGGGGGGVVEIHYTGSFLEGNIDVSGGTGGNGGASSNGFAVAGAGGNGGAGQVFIFPDNSSV